MDDSLENLRDSVLQEITGKTKSAVEQLMSIWEAMFETPNIAEHLAVLPEHIETFFSDIIKESTMRQEQMKKDIEDLMEEADGLRRVLGVEFDFLAQNNMPLYAYRKELNEKMEWMRQEFDQRKEFMKSYIDQLAAISEELEEPVDDIDDEKIPTAAEMEGLKSRLRDLTVMRAERMKDMQDLRFNVQGYVDRLDIMLDGEQEALLRNLQVGKSHFEALVKLNGEMKAQFDELCTDMDRMLAKIRTLWTFLKQPPVPELDGVCDKTGGYCSANHVKLLTELQRCEAIKRENIESYIKQIREEIKAAWDRCHIAPVERERFLAYKSDVYTEDLLQLHELELQDLTTFYETNKQIFEVLDEWSLLWSKMKDHDAKMVDPTRFNNRGGQLLREEKERRALNARVPKVEAQIVELSEAFEELHGRPFMIYGRTIKDFIDFEYEKREEEKRLLQASARKGTANTPLTARNRTLQKTSVQKSSTTKFTPIAASSATKMSSTSTATKRRLSPQAIPRAKRNLIPQMNSTASTRVHPGTALKSTRQVLTHTLKRRSIKRRSLKNKSINKGQQRRNRENCDPADASVSTVSYDAFESVMSSRTPASRSTFIHTPIPIRVQPPTPPTNKSKSTPKKKLTTREFSKLF